MADYIDRQAAIEAICKVCSIVGNYHKCDGYPETSTWCDELVALRAVTPADVQPVRHGHWEKDPRSKRTRCSECYSVVPRDDYRRECLSDYCSVCGARMDGE